MFVVWKQFHCLYANHLQAFYVKVEKTGLLQRWCTGHKMWEHPDVFGGLVRACRHRFVTRSLPVTVAAGRQGAAGEQGVDSAHDADVACPMPAVATPVAGPPALAECVSGVAIEGTASDSPVAGVSSSGTLAHSGAPVSAVNTLMHETISVATPTTAEAGGSTEEWQVAWGCQTAILGGYTAAKQVQAYLGRQGAAAFARSILKRPDACDEAMGAAVDDAVKKLHTTLAAEGGPTTPAIGFPVAPVHLRTNDMCAL